MPERKPNGGDELGLHGKEHVDDLVELLQQVDLLGLVAI
jgi:hypothetical protein